MAAMDRAGRPAVCRLIVALQEEPQTVLGLVDRTGMHENSVRHWIEDLLASGLVSVAGEGQANRGQKPTLYAWRFA